MPRRDDSFVASETALVICIDVGTTFTGAAYALLRKGEVVEPLGDVRPVTRWPGTSRARIPTVMHYPADNADAPPVHSRRPSLAAAYDVNALQRHPRASLLPPPSAASVPGRVRSETGRRGSTDSHSEDFVVRRHKLHFAPAYALPRTKGGDLVELSKLPLPPERDVVTVHADWLRGLWLDLKRYFASRGPSYRDAFNDESVPIHLILTHPNGWGAAAQQRLEASCRRAGLDVSADVVVEAAEAVEKGKGRVKLRFLTEGEAALHFLACSDLRSDFHHVDDRLVVVDAGGGTTDISAYRVKEGASSGPLQVDEVHFPICDYGGSAEVDLGVQEAIRSVLLRTARYPWAGEEHVQSAYRDWLRDKEDWNGLGPVYLRLGAGEASRGVPRLGGGGAPDIEDELGEDADGVVEDTLQLSAKTLRSCFRAVSSRIASRVRKLCAIRAFAKPGRSNAPVTVYFVGGLSRSSCFRSQVTQRLKEVAALWWPEEDTTKAVALGGVHYLLKTLAAGPLVQSYVSGLNYGIVVGRRFDEKRHASRRNLAFEDPVTKALYLDYGFKAIIGKNEPGAPGEGRSEGFYRTAREDSFHLATTLLAFPGDDCPEWLDEGEGQFFEVAVWESRLDHLLSDPLLRSAVDESVDAKGERIYAIRYEWRFRLWGPTLRAELWLKTDRGAVSVETHKASIQDGSMVM